MTDEFDRKDGSEPSSIIDGGSENLGNQDRKDGSEPSQIQNSADAPAFDYYANGTATSPIIDMYDVFNWSSLLANQDGGSTPTGTSYTIEIRTSADNVTWSAYGAIGVAADSRYGQIKITLDTGVLRAETPVINDVYLQASETVLERQVEMDKVIQVTASKILTYFNAYMVTVLCNGTLTITLPQANIIGRVNRIFNIKNIGTGQVTIAGNGADSVELTDVDAGESVSLKTNGKANWYVTQ